MKTICALLFFVCIVIMSCNKETITNTSLTGTWNWISSNGGFTGQSHSTPESTGNSITLTFTEDSHYSRTLNGVITSQGTYSISSKRCIHDGTDKSWIEFSDEGLKNMMIESDITNRLELADEAFDGFGALFEKI